MPSSPYPTTSAQQDYGDLPGAFAKQKIVPMASGADLSSAPAMYQALNRAVPQPNNVTTDSINVPAP